MLQHINQFDFIEELNNEHSSWNDMSSFPSTVTARRMIKLADFAAENKKRWQVIKMRHLYNFDIDFIASHLNISKPTVYRYLLPVRIDSDDELEEEI